MTNKEITSLAFKVCAIFVLLMVIQMISQLQYFHSNFFPHSENYLFLIPVFGIIALFSLGIILWKLSNNIISTMTKDKRENDDDLRVDQPFILNLIGFYLLFHGLLEVSSGTITLIMTQVNIPENFNHMVMDPSLKFQSLFYVLGSVIKIIVALTLILRSKGWVKLFRKIRQF
jgi:hypothetical protein